MFLSRSIYKLSSLLSKNVFRNYCDVACALTRAEVIPDVICVPPKCKAAVEYKGASVCLGNEIAPKLTKCMPKVTWTKPCGYFLVAMLDPDMESRKCPDKRHWLHWLVGNINGADLNTGETIVEYVMAVPGEGTCLHRIVFLVFAQECKVDFCMPKIKKDTACGREKFDLKAFAEKFKLCDLVGANFFVTQSDCESKKKRSELGMS